MDDVIGKIARKLHHIAAAALYRPRIAVDHPLPTVRLGSAYGGWPFVDSPELRDAVIISCGLGEDASFDVEFAARYNARVVMVDPTPRAIRHYNDLIGRLGSPAAGSYAAGGRQPVSAYDLSALGERNFTLVPKALWTSSGSVRFFAPKNTEHVSHSITNFQNQYSSHGAHIDVESITIDALLSELGLRDIPLMKMDIEGAEVEVVSDMVGRGILPRQMLIEFDELQTPSPRNKSRYEATDRKLRDAGYRLANFDGHTNFLYVRPVS